MNKLIDKVKTGDRDSADKLVRIFYDEIYFYIFKITQSKELSLDLTQEVFIRCLKKIKTFNPNKGTFKTWLFKLTHNYVMNYFKSKEYQKFKGQIYEIEYLVDKFDIEDYFIKKENKEKVENIIESLHSKYKQIVFLRFYNDYSIKDIAKKLKINESTVKTRLRRGLINLKKIIESGEINE